MNKHTSGPWEARWPKYDALILDAQERVIASVQFTDHIDTECEANAHLIAAAPELLQCLRYALAHIDGGDVGGYAEVLSNGYAAIAKAEGPR